MVSWVRFRPDSPRVGPPLASAQVCKIGSDRRLQVREFRRFGFRPGMEHDVPTGPQVPAMLANRFPEPPLEPVPLDRAAEGPGNRHSHPAGLLSGRSANGR